MRVKALLLMLVMASGCATVPTMAEPQAFKAQYALNAHVALKNPSGTTFELGGQDLGFKEAIALGLKAAQQNLLARWGDPAGTAAKVPGKLEYPNACQVLSKATAFAGGTTEGTGI